MIPSEAVILRGGLRRVRLSDMYFIYLSSAGRRTNSAILRSDINNYMLFRLLIQ